MNKKFEAKSLLTQYLMQTTTTVDHFVSSDINEVPSSKYRERYILPNMLAMISKDMPQDSILCYRSLDANGTSHQYEQASDFSYKVPSKCLDLRTALRKVSNYFKKLFNKKKSSTKPTSSSGYCIIVSNLPRNITKAVVENLFKCIGELIDIRIVEPGVAEVIYKSFSDAEQAAIIFHNSDMNNKLVHCLLVNPGAPNESTVPAIIPMELP